MEPRLRHPATELDTPDVTFRRHVLDRTALALAILVSFGSLARHLSSPLKTPQLVGAFVLAGVTLSSRFLARRALNPALAALPLCLALMTLFLLAGIFHGGVRAPSLSMLPLLPVIGFFFGGRRLATALFLGVLLVVWGFTLPAGSDDERTRAIVITFITAGGFALGAIYEHSRRLYELQVVESARLVSLGIMASGIAHEINNPLQIIQGYSKLLQTRAANGELNIEGVTNLAERITMTTLRMAKIVSGLRNYSRDDAREPMRPTSLRSVIEDVLALCSERFSDAGITLRVASIPEDVLISARPVQMVQVLLNLLNNAFDAASEHTSTGEPWVAIEFSATATGYTLFVSDSGAGVPIKLRSKIFIPFFTTKQVGRGTGLGLSLCASIMLEHGGEVLLADKTQNTTFELRLPLPS